MTKSKKILPKIAGEFLISEDGQAITEYVLILFAAITASIGIAKIIKNTFDQGILSLGGQLEKDLRTGRAPLNVWK